MRYKLLPTMIESPSTSTPLPLEARPAVGKLRRRMLNPFLMRGYFLAKLPLALFAGLRLRELTEERCVATVP